jgi:hypothetical protein
VFSLGSEQSLQGPRARLIGDRLEAQGLIAST